MHMGHGMSAIGSVYYQVDCVIATNGTQENEDPNNNGMNAKCITKKLCATLAKEKTKKPFEAGSLNLSLVNLAGFFFIMYAGHPMHSKFILLHWFIPTHSSQFMTKRNYYGNLWQNEIWGSFGCPVILYILSFSFSLCFRGTSFAVSAISSFL